jgi:predicted PurR-regulated permease PerM
MRDERLIVRAVATLLAGVVLLIVLYYIRAALLAIYVSGLLALGFSPIIRWFEGRRLLGSRLPRWAAVLVPYVGVLGLVGLIAAAVVPPLLRQASQLGQDLPGNLVRAQTFLSDHGLLTHEWTIDEMLQALPTPGAVLTAVLGALQSVIGTIGTIIGVLVLPYYLLVESDELQDGLLRLVSPSRRPRIARTINDVTFKVGAWLNGQLLLSGIIGVSSSTALWLLGVPYFYVLGLIAALGEFVPIIGPLIAAAPAVLAALTQSVPTGLAVIAFFSVQQFIEGNILVPRIMSRQVGVSASSVIVALLVGSELLGFAGALLAVPSAAIVQVFVHQFLEREPER